VSKIRLKYVDRFTDRHGSVRYYFRRGKGARVPLPGLPGSSEFMAAYQSAADGIEPPKAKPQRGEPGTIDRLVSEYFQSSEFLRLRKTTQAHYRQDIERLVIEEKIGHRTVAGLRKEHIKIILARRASKPGAANTVLTKLKVLMKFAIESEQRQDDPTIGIRRFSLGEIHTWTDRQIEQYEERWPVTTKERLAFALLLYTGQRRSDVVRMSWRDIDDDIIQVTQQKTGEKVWIPIHPNLKQILNAVRKDHISIITSSRGKPYTGKSFGAWLSGKISKADLPGECVTHGLRKAAARRLAEAGCSSKEIASITGHRSLSEVERYTKEADKKQLAKAAVRRLIEHG